MSTGSYSKGVGIFLREIAKRVCPDLEEMDDPMVALRDHDIRQFVPGAPEQGSGCGQQTCHGTCLFLLLSVRYPSRIIVEDQLKNTRPETNSRKPRSRRP